MGKLWQIELFSDDEVSILDIVGDAAEAVANAAAYMGFTRKDLDYDVNVAYLCQTGELRMEKGGWKEAKHYHELIIITEWKDD